MRSVPAWPVQPWISLSLALMAAIPAMPAMSAIPATALETRSPILIHSGDTTQLELASGERLTVSLPAGAAVTSAGALGEHGWVVAALRGQEIVVMTGEAGQAKTLPAPPVAGRLRREPLPLVEDGRLAGLVWLDGNAERALSVRYARFNGATWEKPRTISAPGPGSQLALSAARLGDGTWLLAWSAFDGHDDEIVWSRQDGDGRWSAPRRVTDNDVPDITPALTATADGALLAWSRFDGDGYRVVTSRFHAGAWDAPRAAGPSGSLFPSFEASGTGTFLLYQNAVPSGWSAVEVDSAAGRTARRAALSTSRRARPVVEATADRSGVTFRWPAAGEERAADWDRP